MPTHTITLQFFIPAPLWHACGTPAQVQQWLAAQGAWPAGVAQVAWRIEPESQQLLGTVQVHLNAPVAAKG